MTVSGDARASALAVLNNVLDVQDPARPVPGAMLGEIRHLGAGRETLVPTGRPLTYLFLGANAAPFDDHLAREAVVEGLGAQTLAALCSELEKRGKSGSFEGVEGILVGVEQQYEAVCAALEGGGG